ncbi:SNF2 family N-terminal domain-containing protein [Dactylonectria macrodidyma]|uniref:SNF2 family N-terminal domain-containing protein n=1 Tax=Dactylonectria macrodidyma TaxID=307937 RepID=A0A9P9DEV2_9HYPO|nr:SNF2 family N-terminal domain-containing protein [Dactylonectria macrodidyma]
MAETSPSADMRLPKRLQGFHPPARSQKRIRMTPPQGHIPSPDDAVTNLLPRPQVDIISRPSSDAEAFFGEYQDVDGSDNYSATLPFAGPSPMDIGDEIVGGEANIQICYGALCDVHASFNGSTVGKSLARDSRRFQIFHIILYEDSFGLLSGKNEVVAVLDVDTCRTLQRLHDHQRVRATAVVETSRLKRARVKGTSKGIFPLSINIYGTQDKANEVGDILSEMAAFLQHPFFLEPGHEYFNPQYFHLGGEMKCMTYLVGLGETEYRAKRISDEVEGVFDSLDGADVVPDVQPDAIITRLKSHQKVALAFIERRENHSACQRANKILRDFVRISSKDDIPSYSMGGILADVMGLGKTLSMISAIVSSLPRATEYATAEYQNFVSPASGCRSRATLVIVTSMQVLDVWKREVSIHVEPGTLKICIFHGSSRPKSPKGVIDYDLVLTTYGTLSADSNAFRVLQKIEWYRVVLDEAHWIRNQTSNQFRAAESLSAERKWCLTGTPIQNRLNDLESLLKFLHFDPFSRTSVFLRHILEPLSKDTPDRAVNLRALLHAICLRRNEKYLNLPEPLYEEIDIRLEGEERLVYDSILKKCARDIDEAVSTKAKIKKYHILFATIMKLRRLCNHGTLSSAQISLSATFPSSADGERDCDYCGGNDEDRLALLSNNEICTECGRSLSSTSRGSKSKSLNLGGSTPTPSWDGDPNIFKPSPRSFLSPRHAPQGFSTKLLAVVGNLAKSPPGSKSLVFSYWTSTLELLAVLLKQRNIRSLRIDGRVTYSERLRILARFAENPDIAVLLMSIGTGSVGLNLTVANYVHLVEPQWNPSVEEQAVARAVRIGQTLPVTVTRYIVKRTVEENIVCLQQKKSSLAKFTLDSGPEEGETEKLEDLQFILDLNSA